MTMPPKQEHRAFCGRCRRETRHTVLAAHRSTWKSEDWQAPGMHGSDEYAVLQCNGCDAVHYQTTSWSSEDGPDAYIQRYPTVPTLDGHAPISAEHLPRDIAALYTETIAAVQAGAPILAAVGLRAIVEGVCRERRCEGRNLQERIDRLVETGALAAQQVQFLHQHRLIGNEAAHEMRAPLREELAAALSITEGLLRTLYELPALASEIDQSRRSRELRSAFAAPAPTAGADNGKDQR